MVDFFYRDLDPKTKDAINLLDSVLNDNKRLSSLLTETPILFSQEDEKKIKWLIASKK